MAYTQTHEFKLLLCTAGSWVVGINYRIICGMNEGVAAREPKDVECGFTVNHNVI